jgi:small nuclear ribonucleoprotein (snRNP)-like protein
MNLVLGGAEETIHTIEVSEDGQAQPAKVCLHRDSQATDDLQIEKRNMEMLFVRGDSVILVRARRGIM